MIRPLLTSLAIVVLCGCAPTDNTASKAQSADGTEAVASGLPAPAPANALQEWRSEDGKIAFKYPATLTPTQDFSATYFTPEGWRAMFDGAPVGPGAGQVRFSAESYRAGDDQPFIVTTILQIGTSRDPAVVADCLTRGLNGGNGSQAEDRTMGGVRFTVFKNSDAGMSHQLSSTDLRAVRGGTCIAIDRIEYAVPASVDTEASPDRSTASVEQDMDRVLSSLTFG